MWQVGCFCPSKIRVPSVEVRKRINLYFTWTSVFTLELGLQSKTAAFNLPLNISTKPSKCQAYFLNKNSEVLFPVSKRNCLGNKQICVGCKTVAAT